MEWVEVVSSHLRRVAYSQENNSLHIEFGNGSVYMYENVPEDTFQELVSAPSVGSYFARNIKGQFQYQKTL